MNLQKVHNTLFLIVDDHPILRLLDQLDLIFLYVDVMVKSHGKVVQDLNALLHFGDNLVGFFIELWKPNLRPLDELGEQNHCSFKIDEQLGLLVTKQNLQVLEVVPKLLALIKYPHCDIQAPFLEELVVNEEECVEQVGQGSGNGVLPHVVVFGFQRYVLV